MKILIQSIIEVQAEHEHPISKPSNFCPECGKAISKSEILEKYVCSKCRCVVEEKDKFCFMCGADVSKMDSPQYYHKNQELDKATFSERIELKGIDKGKVK